MNNWSSVYNLHAHYRYTLREDLRSSRSPNWTVAPLKGDDV